MEITNHTSNPQSKMKKESDNNFVGFLTSTSISHSSGS